MALGGRMGLKLSVTTGNTATSIVSVVAGGEVTVGDVAEYLFRVDPSRAGSAPPVDATLIVTPLSQGAEAPARVVPRETAMVAAGVRSGDHVAVVVSRDVGMIEASPPVATVTVIAGPDAGKVVSLRSGSHVIGRDTEAAVSLTDPLASPRHARLVVGETLEIVDMGSTNGVLLDGAFVTRATLVPGDRVVIGGTEIGIEKRTSTEPPVPSTPTVPFTRSPRVVPPLPHDDFTLPTPPPLPTPRPFPRTALLAPVMLGLTMYLMTGRVLSLVFVAMSPLMMMGGFLDNRHHQRKEARARASDFEAALELGERELGEAHRRERAVRLARSPSTMDVCAAVRSLAPPLWTHRSEHEGFLEVRLGLGCVPSSLVLEVPALSNAVEGTWERVAALRDRYSSIADVPVTVSLRSAGGLGVAGDPLAARAIARAAVVQVAGLHSPMECVIAACVPAANAREWAWLEWLPHTSSPASPLAGDHVAATRAAAQRLLVGLEEVVAQRAGKDIGAIIPEARGADARAGTSTAESAEVPVLPAILVVVENGAPADTARLIRLAEKGPDVNVHVLWIARELAGLPAACRSFVEAPGGTTVGAGVAGHVRRGGFDEPVACEALSVTDATEVARRLACVEDVGVVIDDAADVPSAVSYLELHGFDALDPGQTEQRWRRDATQQQGATRPFSLRALVGHAGDEPFYLDLKAQGPHALVGGTTGAGKSEFLQSWILGIAAAYSPEHVTFLYVDYKGGSAFADCVRLPHTVGLVTDLTPHLVERALTSLRAELHFRERLLAAKGAKDLETLVRSGEAAAPPSLVIVIDEFAALAKEVPDFVDGVVDIAQRGRSLGLHLIMATQRPAGVIKDNLRANTNLRIALRMADEADSSDILGVPAAAHVDPSLPGRAMARTGPGRLATFQAAYAGAHSVPGGSRARVRVRALALGAGHEWEMPDDARAVVVDGESDAARVVAALSGAARLLNVAEPRRPWLDDLADTYDLNDLARSAPTGAAFALVDHPSKQSQFVGAYHPDVDGNMLVLGGAGAGKSTTLRTIGIGATLARELAPVHLYGIDAASGGLDMLRSLPHVGDVVDADDSERIGRLMSRLVGIVRERSATFTAARASNLTEYRASSGDRGMARVFLLIDGYGTFQSDYMNELGRQQTFGDFQEVLAEGRSAGVHVVMSADRVGALHTSVQAMVSRTLVLRLSDENQYGMLGLRKTGLTPQSPAGRGVDVASRNEMQVAVYGGLARVDAQSRAIEHLAASIPDSAQWKADPIPRMPAIVLPRDMPASVDGRPVLGVDGGSLAPRGFDVERPIMIAGQAGTGRTNALAWLASSIAIALPKRRIVHVTQRRTSIGDLPHWTASFVGASAAEDFMADWGPELEKPAEGDDQIVLCIENVQDFGASMSDGPLIQAIKQGKRNGHLLIGEADTQGWVSGQLVSEIKGARRGLLLAPEGSDAQMLFGAPSPRMNRADMPVGRAAWVESGRVSMVQVPCVDRELSPDRGT